VFLEKFIDKLAHRRPAAETLPRIHKPLRLIMMHTGPPMSHNPQLPPHPKCSDRGLNSAALL
jgi:hypothetical protein